MATMWWVGAGAAVAAELASGTFYLLMIALGLAAGGVAAQVGMPLAWQVVAAALVGGGATVVLHWRRLHGPRSAPARTNRDVNLDIGERVDHVTWGPDRTTRVDYRGSTWSARLEPDAPARSGRHVVCAVEGNWLVLRPDAASDADAGIDRSIDPTSTS